MSAVDKNPSEGLGRCNWLCSMLRPLHYAAGMNRVDPQRFITITFLWGRVDNRGEMERWIAPRIWPRMLTMTSLMRLKVILRGTSESRSLSSPVESHLMARSSYCKKEQLTLFSRIIRTFQLLAGPVPASLRQPRNFRPQLRIPLGSP